MPDTRIAEWVTVIKTATDPDSPFRGLVDLTGIFDLPLGIQQAIYDALSDDQREQLQAVYGPKEDA